jgi:uncharacterized protein YndB with AHSA1/START domain
MTVTSATTDADSLTLTFTSEFNVPPTRVWQLWEDPRLLERWWGPPTYPATFVDHDLTPGGRMSYYMTGPNGDQPHGWWRILEVEAPQRLTFESGFADADGEPAAQMPYMTVRVSLDELPEGGTRMVIVVAYATLAAMEKVLAMGMVDGMTGALGQIDELLR